ncbi:nicotinate-nucleotide--dimethylbenzimidazole phosphoribosyltransferase [Streptomyces sp. WM6386]|uniref:nicotinate-nucleotide--dimethylbenzimidazole phosphoribosyltransferase n=1 Tax=Streptomyces sp. WM6386 TaxID=1415558 RepID=UPI000619D83E|nr:nicotinate-nucleotide--dimethylbenzimidazole phosphoribosyltransferase [Streptomyces sp. WM6386]KKD04763.1 nicotinate-nucleotide--dimethylbenzimidazole phosphoribosyltransferase [Streptomyces sp. WM6386]
MTDTGQVPGEGLPENAGMVEQPGVPAHGAYTYLSETTAEDEDLLLLPGAQGAWGNEVAPPAPEPVVETVHAPGPHEMSGRDSGAHDLSAVRAPDPVAAPSLPIPPITPRRPLHLGPPIPDASASPVRSLADRGPAGAPVRQSGPPTAGPEYLDVPQPLREMSPQGAAPWGAPTPVGTMAPAAETVVPVPEQGAEPAGAAQAAVARPATEAVAASGVPQPQEDVYAEVMAGTDGVPVAGEAYGEAVVAEHAPEAGGFPGSEGLPVAGIPGADGFPGAEGIPGDSYAPGAETVQSDVNVPGPVVVPEAGAANAPEANGIPVAAHTPDGIVPEAADGSAVVFAPEGGEAPAAGQIDGPESAGEAGQDVGAAPVPEAGPVPGAVDAADVAQGSVAEDPAGAGQVPGAVEVPDPAPVPDAVEVADFAPVTAPAVVPDADQTPTGVPLPDLAQTPEVPLAPEPAEPQAVPEPEASGPEVAQIAEPPVVVAEVAEPTAVLAEPAGLQGVPVPDAPGPEADQVAEPTAVQAEPAELQGVPVPDAPGPEAGQVAVPTPVVAEAAVPEPVPAPENVLAPEPVPTPEATAAAPAPEPAEAAVPTPQPAPEPAALETPAPMPSPESTDAEQPPHPVDAEAAAQPEPPAAVAEQLAQPEDAPAPVDVTQEQTGQPVLVDAAPQFADAPDPAPVPEAPQPVTAPADAPVDDLQAVPVAPVDPAPAPWLVAEPAGPQVLFVDQDQPIAQAPQPVGQFVPVEGSVPTTPHLAPTPPQALVLPPEEHPAVPGPRDGDPELVQHADDLDTRGADQEESTAPVEEVRQSTGPAAPAYEDAEREAVLKVMRERRDIRNGFRSDPIPHEVLLRVLEAAHTAPSVGHSQPWDFVVIRSAETRRTMHELAMRQRDAYAKSLPKGRAKQFKELKIEAILDTPVNIVVTADPTRGGRHTLGRHTQPQMAPYSSALAVENLWLAARAEGLGVGWVSFFDEREMVRSLGLPEHLEVVAYLCVGYVDEFPDEPELLQAGWSKRRPLSWVVHEETYGRRALPGEEPHDLLAETVSQIRPLDAKALGEAWERQKRMTKPPGSLGMLEIISAQLSGLSRQCPPPIPEPAAVAIFAGDHGVHAQGVTPWPQEVTAQMVANFLGGGAVCNAFAAQVGAEVCVVDVGVAADLPATPGLLPRKVRAGTSDMTTGPAMTREEAKQAIEVGIETARDLVAAGNKALLTGEMGIANTTASAALISVFTDTDPADVTGRGTGINDETLARKTEVVRRAIEVHQPDPADPVGVLAAIGGFEHAAMVGLLLGGASLRTPVILDGVSAGAAALVARAIAPEVLAACIAGHRSAEPGHVAALNKLGLRPLVDLDLRLGEGTGALLALPLVQSTARAMHEVATFDSAGVTEK